MTRRHHAQMLINFLKQEGILIVFFVNMLMYGTMKSFDGLITRTFVADNQYSMSTVVRKAFNWGLTSEGWLYWARLEDKWYRYWRVNMDSSVLLPTPSKGYKSYCKRHTEFYNWLREKGVLSIYMANVHRDHYIYRGFRMNPKQNSADNWIGHAFKWSRTTEGHGFWSSLNNQWKSICYTQDRSKAAQAAERRSAVPA